MWLVPCLMIIYCRNHGLKHKGKIRKTVVPFLFIYLFNWISIPRIIAYLIFTTGNITHVVWKWWFQPTKPHTASIYIYIWRHACIKPNPRVYLSLLLKYIIKNGPNIAIFFCLGIIGFCRWPRCGHIKFLNGFGALGGNFRN